MMSREADQDLTSSMDPSSSSSSPSSSSSLFSPRLSPSNVLVLAVMMLTIVSNLLIIAVVFKTKGFKSFNKSFFLSLTATDLILGVFVFPFCFISGLDADWRDGWRHPQWVLGDIICHVEAYLATICFVASIYSLMWLSVDHYIAIRKPERYESIMTHNKARCWILFVWLAALFFCCPPLFGYTKAYFYKEAYICLLDWSRQRGYFVSSLITVAGLPIITLSIIHGWMFTDSYRKATEMYEKTEVCELNRTQSFRVTSIVGLLFVIMWGPWCTLRLLQDWRRIYGHSDVSFLPTFSATSSSSSASSSSPSSPSFSSSSLSSSPFIDSLSAVNNNISHAKELAEDSSLDFPFMWFALSNSFAKFFVYLMFSAEFRQGLKKLFSRSRRSRTPPICRCLEGASPTNL